MAKLFISYRSLDSAKVDVIVARLQSLKNADGTPLYDTWQDKKNIPVGHDWWKAIIQGIIDCDIFIFMISSESIGNINCRAELSYAWKRNRPIIPLVLDGEFNYNTDTGKNNIAYWDGVPDELNDGRLQFLFYEGASFVGQLKRAVDELLARPLRDMPASEPPDPRNASDASNDTSLIYDRACDYAWRMDFVAAEKLFKRLMNWGDPLFAEDAREWILLLRSYEQMARLHELESSRYKLADLWAIYSQQFPKPFTPLFDPKDFKRTYGNNFTVPPPPVNVTRSTGAKSAPTTLPEATRSKVSKILPAPFAWVNIPGKNYSISKYPVTNAQYAKFIEAGGYRQGQWWTDNGWLIRQQKNWLQPRYWNDKQWNGGEYPVVGVSWYEAVAFCRWLSSVTEENIMLPNEQQWQYAGQGDDVRNYPWGDNWDSTRCNNGLDGTGKTTPVRQYEGKGNSPFGVVDMVGNVWEWCRNNEKRNDDINIKSQYRVLRGGSWLNISSENFDIDYRSWDTPVTWNGGIGFRLALN